jgi:Leucine-rich repeat (LRR) protein
MKQSYLFCLLFISLFSSAQIINFTDANFKAKLLAANPSSTIASTEIPTLNNDGNPVVISYNKIDMNDDGEIQISEAQNIKYLNLSNNITNLSGIEYFTNLQVLNCPFNQLTNLNGNQFTDLIYLNCSYNQLQNLEITGLTNLKKLICDNNQLTNLNVSGLTSLQTLYCYTNLLTSINLNGLPNLKYLYCLNNQLTSLNTSGLINLEYLDCKNNQLTTLNISSSINLVELDCKINFITELNLTGLNNLQNLYCGNNLLTNLNLTGLNNLQNLHCINNQITNLNAENLSNLGYLNCDNNQLTLLNIKGISNNFTYLSFQNNPNLQYICVDENAIEIINQYIQQAIIPQNPSFNCNVNSYCSFVPGGTYYTIQGQQKFDNENDGCDITDSTFPNLKYSITDGIITGSIISNNSGNYAIPVQAGQYTITPILENPNYFTATPPNVVMSFPTQTSPFTQDFCIRPNGIKHDVEVSIIPTTVARPGFDAIYKIIYKNKGNQVENGTINLQFNDAVLDIVSTNPAFTTQTLNNLSFNYSNLNPFETREISVVLNVNSPVESPAVNAGDFLIYIAEITQLDSDELPIDNTFGLKQLVVNSLDPNDKTCLQGTTISPSEVGKYVHYMIRFENTGTFPAENIVVKDMIDTTKFDVSSLVPLNASHNYVTKISGNKVEFIFENINLPFDDANNDGYIAFKIKTLPSLVIGNTFSNSANIYFDYNFPIVTNTATTTIAALNNPSFEFANYFSLYPNPTSNELNIALKSAIEINSIEIYNPIGQLVTVQTGNALKVDVSNLKTGNYFIKINTNEGFSTSQFIKE